MSDKINGIYEASLMVNDDIAVQHLNRDREFVIVSDSIDNASSTVNDDNIDGYYIAYTYTNPAGKVYRRNLVTKESMSQHNFLKYLKDGTSIGTIQSTSLSGGALTGYTSGEYSIILGESVKSEQNYSFVYGLGNQILKGDLDVTANKSSTIIGGESSIIHSAGNASIIAGFNNFIGGHTVMAVVRKMVTTANWRTDGSITSDFKQGYEVAVNIPGNPEHGKIFSCTYNISAWVEQSATWTIPGYANNYYEIPYYIFNLSTQQYYKFDGTNWTIQSVNLNMSEKFSTIVGGFRNSINANNSQASNLIGGYNNSIEMGNYSSIIGGMHNRMGNIDADGNQESISSVIMSSQRSYLKNTSNSGIYNSMISYINSIDGTNEGFNTIIGSHNSRITDGGYNLVLTSINSYINEAFTHTPSVIVGSFNSNITGAHTSVIYSSYNSSTKWVMGTDNQPQTIIGSMYSFSEGNQSSISNSYITYILADNSNQIFNSISNSAHSTISKAELSQISASNYSSIWNFYVGDNDTNKSINASTAVSIQGPVSYANISSSSSRYDNSQYGDSLKTYILSTICTPNGGSVQSSDYSSIESSYASRIINAQKAIIKSSEQSSIKDYSYFSSIKRSVNAHISLESHNSEIDNSSWSTISNWATRSSILSSFNSNIYGNELLKFVVSGFINNKSDLNGYTGGESYYGINNNGLPDDANSTGKQILKINKQSVVNLYDSYVMESDTSDITIASSGTITGLVIEPTKLSNDGRTASANGILKWQVGMDCILHYNSSNYMICKIASFVFDTNTTTYHLDLTIISSNGSGTYPVGYNNPDRWILEYKNEGQNVPLAKDAYRDRVVHTTIEYFNLNVGDWVININEPFTYSGGPINGSYVANGRPYKYVSTTEWYPMAVDATESNRLYPVLSNIINTSDYANLRNSNASSVIGSSTVNINNSKGINVLANTKGTINNSHYSSFISSQNYTINNVLNSVWLGVNSQNAPAFDGATAPYLNNAVVIESIVFNKHDGTNFLGGRIYIKNAATGEYGYGTPGQVLKSGGPNGSIYWE